MKSDWKDFFLDTMEKRFLEMKAKNKRFSVRRFADMAKVSAGTMSMILSRQETWNLSPERALSVFQNVKMDTDKTNILALKCSPIYADTQSPLPERDEKVFLTNPYYMPICLSFSLTSTPSIQTIARCLQIPEIKVISIIDDLVKRGYLVIQDGRITKGQPKKYSSGGNDASKTYHINNLEKVREALIHGTPEDRDISGVLLTGDSKHMAAVKEEINQFYSRIHAILNSSETANDIFRIFVGFVPLRMGSEAKTGVL